MDAISQLLLEVTSTIDSLFDSYVRSNALLPREHCDKEGRTPWKLKHFGRRRAALYGSIAHYIAVCGCISPGQDLPALNPIKLPITGKRPPSINALSAQRDATLLRTGTCTRCLGLREAVQRPDNIK